MRYLVPGVGPFHRWPKPLQDGGIRAEPGSLAVPWQAPGNGPQAFGKKKQFHH